MLFMGPLTDLDCTARFKDLSGEEEQNRDLSGLVVAQEWEERAALAVEGLVDSHKESGPGSNGNAKGLKGVLGWGEIL